MKMQTKIFAFALFPFQIIPWFGFFLANENETLISEQGKKIPVCLIRGTLAYESHTR